MEVYYALIAKKINIKSEKYNKFICKDYKDFLKFESVLEDFKFTLEPGFSFFIHYLISLFLNITRKVYMKIFLTNMKKYKK